VIGRPLERLLCTGEVNRGQPARGRRPTESWRQAFAGRRGAAEERMTTVNEEMTAHTPSMRGGDIEVSDSSRLPSQPLVSVAMVTYNHGPYIREALESVLMQQVDFPYEVCVGEDGSTDGTREICLEYAQKYPDRVRVFLRNRDNPARQSYRVPFMHNVVQTCKACRGRYLALLEGDDYWISRFKLARQVAALEADPTAAVAVHYVARIPEETPWKAYMVPGLPLRAFTLEDLLRGNLFAHTSSLLLRDWQQAAPEEIFRQGVCGDVPLLFGQLLRGRCIVLPQVMSVYRVHGSGVYGTQAARVKSERADILWETLRPFVPAPLCGLHRRSHIKLLADATAEYRKAGLVKAALGSSRKALSLVTAAPAFPWPERIALALGVAEGLFFPRLRRLRQRLVSHVVTRRYQRTFEADSHTV
jgi:hypothetical protein